MRKQQWAIIGLTLWLSTIVFFLIASSFFDLELFVAYALIGILVANAMLEPIYVKPRHIFKLNWIATNGVVIFIAIVVYEFLRIFIS